MMKITGLSHIFKWDNLHNWWLTRAVRYGQKIYITIFFPISILITILTQTDMLYLTHLVFAHLTCFCTSYLFLHILLVFAHLTCLAHLV